MIQNPFISAQNIRNLINLFFLVLVISGNSQTTYALVWADGFDGNETIDANKAIS